MNRISLFTLLLVSLFMPATLFGSDWPQFRGSYADGISRERGINKHWNQKPPKLVWKIAMNDDGYAGPSVAGGKVFIVDHKDKQDIVRAIDIHTGKDVWQFEYNDIEHPNFGFTRATPTVLDGRVYTLGRLGVINCIDEKNGRKIWSRDVMKEFQGKLPVHDYTYSLLVDDKRVICVPGGPNASVVALDWNTGQTVWQVGSDEPGYATPQKVVINGKPQYLVFTAKELLGLEPDSGKVLWSFPWVTFEGKNVAAPIPMGNTIFITTGYEHGSALVEVAADGKTTARWKNKEMQGQFSSPLLIDGYVYGDTDPGDYICLDPRTGVTKWRKPGFEKGPCVAVDNVIIAAEGNTGYLAMIDPNPQCYRELGRFKPLGNQIWVCPIISNGNLIVRDKSYLACYSLK